MDYGVADVDVTSFALYLHAELQGGFVVAEAVGDPQAAHDSGQRLKRYVILVCRGDKQ